MEATEVPVHPVQGNDAPRFINTKVTLAAYEVYRRVYGPQDALITGGCRGGFGVGELIAFLYAKNFPQNEWRQRVDEALEGMRRR